MTTNYEVNLPGPKLIQPLKDISSGPAWLDHYVKTTEQLRQKVGPEVFNAGSMFLVDLRDRNKAVGLPVLFDPNSPGSESVGPKLKGGKGSYARGGLHLQIARTGQINFNKDVSKPKTEYTLLDTDRYSIEPVAPASLYTLPSEQVANERIPVVGVVGTVYEGKNTTGAILWFPSFFYLSEAKLAVPGGGE